VSKRYFRLEKKRNFLFSILNSFVSLKLSAIKEDEEKKEEQDRFDATLEQIKEAHSLARKTLDATREANENNVKIQKGINAAALSADNILTRICAVIVKAENTTTKARLDDESMKQLHDMHAQWLGQKELKLADHNQQQEAIWQKQSQRLTNIVKNNEGVWISTKLFYIVGSLSLLSIITIAMEIAFYVYFHWL